jgi:hypothetical protein
MAQTSRSRRQARRRAFEDFRLRRARSHHGSGPVSAP